MLRTRRLCWRSGYHCHGGRLSANIRRGRQLRRRKCWFHSTAQIDSTNWWEQEGAKNNHFKFAMEPLRIWKGEKREVKRAKKVSQLTWEQKCKLLIFSKVNEMTKRIFLFEGDRWNPRHFCCFDEEERVLVFGILILSWSLGLIFLGVFRKADFVQYFRYNHFKT